MSESDLHLSDRELLQPSFRPLLFFELLSISTKYLFRRSLKERQIVFSFPLSLNCFSLLSFLWGRSLWYTNFSTTSTPRLDTTKPRHLMRKRRDRTWHLFLPFPSWHLHLTRKGVKSTCRRVAGYGRAIATSPCSTRCPPLDSGCRSLGYHFPKSVGSRIWLHCR